MPKGYPKAKMEARKQDGMARLMEKYKAQIGERDEFIDFNVRGEKARKLAEIAQVVKAMGTSQSFQIPIPDFEKAYGPGQKGRTYVKSYMRKFGILNPRVESSSDKIHIWYRGKVEAHG